MPVRTGQTGWGIGKGYFKKSDPFEDVRKEFERKDKTVITQGKQIVTELATPASGTQKPQTITQPDTSVAMVCGDIWLNILPIAFENNDPPNDLQDNPWKYYPRNYDPDHGFYGWYVYNIINHNFSLDNPNDYLINLTDLHDTYEGLSYGCDPQIYLPHHFGLDGNRILISGIFKGNTTVMEYFGVSLSNELELNDDGTAKTNLHFRYYVLRKIKKLYKEFING